MQFVAVRLPVPDQLAALAPAQGHVEPKADAPVVRYSGSRPQAPEIPAPVDRPPTPPVPPHVGASRGTRPFTAFDAHYGHRTFYCHGFASHPERLQQVLQASPALGRSPRFQWLDVEVAGLPTPQLVLQAAHVPPQHWTFPLDLRPCGGHMCVFIASRHCSVLEFMARASDSWHMSALVAEGVFALEVDGHRVDAEASTAFKFASIARLRRNQIWGCRRVFRRHGATAHMLPEHGSPREGRDSGASGSTSAPEHTPPAYEYYPLAEECILTNADFAVLVHAVGVPSQSISVPHAADVELVCQLATQAFVHLLPDAVGRRCRWRPCPATPVGEHALHSVLVLGEPEAQAESQIVLDLRAMRPSGPLSARSSFRLCCRLNCSFGF